MVIPCISSTEHNIVLGTSFCSRCGLVFSKKARRKMRKRAARPKGRLVGAPTGASDVWRQVIDGT